MQTDCQSPSLPRLPPADFVEIAVCAMRAFKDELERQKQYALRAHDIAAIPPITTLPEQTGINAGSWWPPLRARRHRAAPG
jgi:hypothetical protein